MLFSKSFSFGKYRIHVWADKQWFWELNSKSLVNDQTYQCVTHYLGYLVVGYWWNPSE